MKVTAKQLIAAVNLAIATRTKKDLGLVYEGVLIALDKIDLDSMCDEDTIALDKALLKAEEKLAA